METGAVITKFLQLCTTVNHLQEVHTLFLKTLSKPLKRQLLPRFVTALLELPGRNDAYARQLFDEIPQCTDQFLWTSVIRYHVRHARCTQAIVLYAEMHRTGVPPSRFTFSSVLNACARLPAILEGKQVHKRLIQSGLLPNNKIVETTLLDMYAKCGFLDDARKLYDEMGEKNSVTWVAMIAGYGKCGDVKEARSVFDCVRETEDASCWAAMVACYAQNGCAKEAIDMYMEMRAREVKISDVAIVGALSACTQLGDAELATTLAADVGRLCRGRGVFVWNALIHMHAKCGSLDLARKEFNAMKERDVITYSTMITALADHGQSQEALSMFQQMQNEGLRPNEVTFISILNACSHGGLVKEGCESFELMTSVFGIRPLAEHVTCMVDLLGRAGQLERAYNLVMENVELANDPGIWGAFHAACRLHGDVEMGEMAARKLGEMDPEDPGNQVVLASGYASNSDWQAAEKVRKMISGKGTKRSPGCSWISG
ncbi:unnamed protein product [Linum tenue]|uniref:Pentatricopeptide repeat-containing protein n=2 Tax=Linum tenue TaxID=586396 RepID=A0AAV0PJ87_9ROSI|nr:unnamed protein product [Linum tenue]